MAFRTEHDSMGEVQVPADRYWGAQTERSRRNFQIGVGHETMPEEILHAFGILKKAAARANHHFFPEKMDAQKLRAIEQAADEVIRGDLKTHFPLVVWQTGSGTQSNMNVNEVIANRANEMLSKSGGESLLPLPPAERSSWHHSDGEEGTGREGRAENPAPAQDAGRKPIHPNDDVNMSQSSNDTFPTAMHIAAVLSVEENLLPAIEELVRVFRDLEERHQGIVKTGRTHLQDAVPIAFSQEISGWRASLERDAELIQRAMPPLSEFALGATAVGTGLNAPQGFSEQVQKELLDITGREFFPAENKFHALSSKDEIVFMHGALKALAADLMKIANDVRWLASGPRCGLMEIQIPENEPGSSIMPGKVNPTQCEQMTMVAVQVMGNDAAIGFAASQGNFELNVFMPVIAYNFLQSVRLLSESISSFTLHCATGIRAREGKMRENLENSLMLVTALNPYIGYENAAKTAHLAYQEGISLREACLRLGFLSAEHFDEVFHPEEMI